MTREELQHDFHNEQGINWLNSQGEPDIDYVMWLENKILAIKNNTPLPPAEGAEEILRIYWFGIVDKRLDLPKTYDRVFKVTVAAMNEFATLHAQRLAEKMMEWISVKEKLPTREDADEYGTVLIYRETNSDQMGMSKTIYDYAMVKYCDEQTYWMKLQDKP